MGATIVDAIDTLHIMGLTEEYQKARDWIATSLNFDIVGFAHTHPLPSFLGPLPFSSCLSRPSHLA